MVKIISDSTSDLTKELIDKLDISVIPLHILLGNDEYRDGIDITPDKIYEWADENKTTPKTSAVSIDDTIEMFKCVLEEDRDIVAFAISEDMSTTANVFRLAARELEAEDRIHVIDSENLSTGIGHLVVEAAVMAGKGMSAADIEKNILELRPRVRASFVVDTLTYLHRGGRCSGLAAMAGGVLKLHPRIEVNNGKMNPGKKYRGRMKNVVLDYVKDMEEDLKKAKKDRVFITHSGCDKEIVDEVKNYLKQLDVFDEIYETRAGGVISSHCGPGTLGVLFIAGEQFQEKCMAKFTKKAIMDCFLNMLKRKNIDRVTVTDICEECGINRNTFYYYFSDIYDVLDSVLIEETEKNIDITEDATFYETYSKAASVIIEYRAAVIHVYNSRNRDIIEKYLHNTTEYLVGLFVKKYSKDHKLTEDDREYITCFYSYSIVGIVSRWIGDGMPPYDKDLIKRFSESFDATIDTMINLCEANN